MATTAEHKASPSGRRPRARIRQVFRKRLVLAAVCVALGLVVWQGRPWFADFANWRGRNAVNLRKLDAALAWFQRAEALDSGRGESQFWMARVERLRGRPDLMQAHLERALKAGFPAIRLHREQVLARMQSGHMGQAEGEVSALLMDAGDDAPAICEAIASGYLAAFRLKEAMTVLEAWKRDYPQDPQPLVIRGMYFAQRQTWSQAAEEFEKALAMAPHRDDVRLQWAEALRNLHQLDAAREQFERCRRSSPRNPAALIGLGRCLLESGELVQARERFEQALKITPDSWDGRFWLGKLLATDGDAERAVPLLDAVCRERPYEPDVRYSLAMALQAAGRRAEAQEHFQYVAAQQRAQSELRNQLELLERSPTRVDLRFQIGKTLLEYGNPDEGISWLQSALELDADHPESLAALAEYASRREKLQKP
ncbi:MAG: tetratricopeptide repeat protein [Planctomycetaceae bacterium]|nr:tetratricopeptide repeat protein [Planctomycetaceae bacterium]